MKSRNTCCPRILFAVALLLPLVWTGTLAQSPGKISGVITESGSGEPLPGCNVVVTGTRLGGTTGPDGSFFVLNVPPGKYDISASLVGYQRTIQRGVIVNADRTTTVNFTLTGAALTQQEIVVEAGRPDVEREKTSTSAIIRTDDIQQIAGMRDVGDVLGLAADITDGHFRGGREGEELYLLQGMGITNPLNSSSAFLPIMSAVEEVEVITSGFGAQYGNAQSGVVNISMKEGKADAWHSRFETRMRGPGRKHFGPSIFDPQANPYLAFFLDPANWLRTNPGATNSAYYAAMGGLGSLFGQDTAVQLQVAQALWRLESRRDINRNYGKDMDYSLEGSTGGPIDDNLRMFVALRSYNNWPVFPTESPDIQRQVMGNVVADLGNSAALRLSGGYAENTTHVFPSVNGLGFYNWLWDRVLSIDYDKTTNTQVGLRFTQTLSPSTFFELKLNSLYTRHRRGSTPSPSTMADSLIVNPQNSKIDWDKVIGAQNGAPDYFNYLKGDDEFRDEKTATYSFEGSLTSQVTKSHLLNAGLQANVFDINVNNRLSVRQGDGGPVEIYTGTPYEAALYMQDKMEFQGMIANVGLRMDVWNSNLRYYPDQMIPYRVFNNAYPGDTTWTYSRDAVQKIKAPLVARLQPRIGVSFPVSVNTVFHLNYGSFMQRPPLQYELGQQVKPVTYEPIFLGNPRLEPQTTNSYDLGVMQGLGEGFTLDVSGYYKDVRNLIEQATFVSSHGSYTSYFNRDYADIRGFRVALSKRRGSFAGTINYQFSVATGKSATVSNAPPIFVESQTQPYTVTTELTNVPIRDILLDFDRTHNLIVTLGYTTSEVWGPALGGFYPLGDITVSTNSFFRSGRPYTPSTNTKLLNSARTPGEYNTDLRVTKRIPNVFGTTASLYVEVFNLFDNKILNYTYLFSTPNAGTPNNNVENYDRYSIDDPNNGVRYWQTTNMGTPFGVDQSFLIYSNAPRSFNFGFVLEF